MLPKWHILIGGIFSLILVGFFNFSYLAGIVIFFSSWLLIDLDHYILFMFRTRGLHPVRFWNYFMELRENYRKVHDKDKFKKPLFIFHGVEPLVILLVFYFLVHSFFLWVFVGFLIHLITDLVHEAFESQTFPKISIIYSLVRNKSRWDFEEIFNNH